MSVDPAISLENSYSSGPQTVKDLKDRITETYSEELIIGICGPIGTNMRFVISELKTLISEKFGYEVVVIKLSDFIRKYKTSTINRTTTFQKLNELIEGGNELRKANGNMVLAELAVSEIAVKREKLRKQDANNEFRSHRICYIIDNIKNDQELELFRLVYSSLFYLIGVFSNLEIREKNLEVRGITREEIYRLIDRDSGEEIAN